MSDRSVEAVVAALKQAMAEPGEHRLYRSGKLAGLFASRSGVAGDAAARALRDEFLTVVRTEMRGKTMVEWVALTPKGIEFLHAHESPLTVLRQMHETLAVSRAGIPRWLESIQQQWVAFSEQVKSDLQQTIKRLDALSDRVEEALRRADAVAPKIPDAVGGSLPWALASLEYLDQRRFAGAPGDCPLPELFSAVRESHPQLSIIEFQDGLRRLADHGALRLIPLGPDNGAVPEPEFVMVDGPTLLYFANRK